MEIERRIIPVAGGKGGVGKSFLTANLAIALAEMGHSTIALDLDLGASNLFSFLGLPNKYPGIGDFLKARTAELDELLVPTDIPKLQFLPGDGKTPFMANIPYAQKQRLISRIMNLPAEYIIMDLGAGSSFNTLDFFRLSHQGLVITTSEHPALLNMLTFLKMLVFRIIDRAFPKNSSAQDVLETLDSFYKKPFSEDHTSVSDLTAEVYAKSPVSAKRITALCRNYRPRVIFNLGTHPDEINTADQIDKSLQTILSIQADYFGFVFTDPSVREAIKERTPFLLSSPQSIAGECIYRIANRIVNYWERSVPDSAQLLLTRVREAYESRA